MVQVCCQLNELKVPFLFFIYSTLYFFLSSLFFFNTMLYWCMLIFDKLSDPDLILSCQYACSFLSRFGLFFMLHTKSFVVLISYFLHYFGFVLGRMTLLYKLIQRYPLVHLLLLSSAFEKYCFRCLPMIVLFDFTLVSTARSMFDTVEIA